MTYRCSACDVCWWPYQTLDSACLYTEREIRLNGLDVLPVVEPVRRRAA